jgi:ABC-2 type transport system ATP-binding protein
MRAAGAEVQTVDHDTLLVTGLDLAAIGDAALAAGIALHELSPDAGSLEDVFIALTSGTAADAVPITSPPTTTQEALTS